MAKQARGMVQPAHQRAFDMRSLWRLAMWGTAATGALALAVLSAYSNTGSQRLMVATVATTGNAQQPAPPIAAQFASRSAESDNETRRLSEAVRALTTDRDRLLNRIASLERSVEDVTGSIKHQAASTPPALAPVPPAPRETTPPATETAGPSAPVAADPPATAGRIASIPATEAPEMEQSQTRAAFGVDIGGAVSFDGLRVLWTSAKGANAALFEGLHPVVSVRENKSRGTDLRLIVGPLASTEAVTRLCASLAAARRYCQPVAFEGQQLSLAAPEPERRPVATPQPQRNSAPQPQRPTTRPNP